MHSLLYIDSFNPSSYLKTKLAFDFQQKWDYLRVILKKTAQLATSFDWENSTMSMYYEANRDLENNVLKIFKCPNNLDSPVDLDE